MIFTQNINFGNDYVTQEVMNMCKSYIGCDGCPLREREMEINGQAVRCETGMLKGNNTNG